MSATIRDNTPFVLNYINIRGSIFLRNMMDEIERESDPKTPKKSGRLRMDKIKQVLGLRGKMAWGKDYAAVQELGRRKGSRPFSNYTTAGTGAHYAENAMKKTPALTQRVAKMSGWTK
jgi:hypothetical protein